MGRDWFPKRTIGSLVDDRATRDGAREALVFEERRWTFAELAWEVDAVARGLINLGIGPGDKVSLWMMNRPEWIYAALAVMRIGAVLVPINTRFRTDDAAYVLSQSDSTTLIIAAQSGQSTISQWCASYCRRSVPVVMSCATPSCRRCGASSC